MFGRVSWLREQLSQTCIAAFAIPSNFDRKELNPWHYNNKMQILEVESALKTDQTMRGK